MKGILTELKALLDKYNAAIVRSATEGNKLVICETHGTHTDEHEFNEDICSEGIEHEWYEFKRIDNINSFDTTTGRTRKHIETPLHIDTFEIKKFNSGYWLQGMEKGVFNQWNKFVSKTPVSIIHIGKGLVIVE